VQERVGALEESQSTGRNSRERYLVAIERDHKYREHGRKTSHITEAGSSWGEEKRGWEKEQWRREELVSRNDRAANH